MPLNYFPTGQQLGWRECHVVNGANPPRTTILTAASIEKMGGRESVQVKQWVNSALGCTLLGCAVPCTSGSTPTVPSGTRSNHLAR